jgi:hypothetical protein
MLCSALNYKSFAKIMQRDPKLFTVTKRSFSPATFGTRFGLLIFGATNLQKDDGIESAFIPFVSFGDLYNNTFKYLTSSLSVEHEIQYDKHI